MDVNQNSIFKKDASTAVFFILPTLLLIGLLVFYPIVRSLLESLHKSTLILATPEFVGIGNYIKILQSEIFYQVLWQSGVWTIVVIAFQFAIGLGSAFLLQKWFPGRDVVRALVILPWIIPGVVAGMLWRLLYDPQLGMINRILFDLGIIDQYVTWLSDKNLALFAVIFVAIWKGFPFSALMYMAALQGVSQDLLDASRIDGLGRVGQFFYVVIPQISPVIRITVLLTAIWTFNYFDIIYIMTGGGPGNSTHIFPSYIYNLSFKQFRFGLATSYAIITFIILLIFSIVYMRELDRKEVLD
jgi:ABC-type sugar transport system permease subunit